MYGEGSAIDMTIKFAERDNEGNILQWKDYDSEDFSLTYTPRHRQLLPFKVRFEDVQLISEENAPFVRLHPDDIKAIAEAMSRVPILSAIRSTLGANTGIFPLPRALG